MVTHAQLCGHLPQLFEHTFGSQCIIFPSAISFITFTCPHIDKHHEDEKHDNIPIIIHIQVILVINFELVNH